MIKSRSAALGLLVMAFVLGGMTGAATTVALSSERPFPAKVMKKWSKEGYARDLKDSLQLKESTKQAIVEIMERHDSAFGAILSSVRARMESEIRTVRSEIRTLLATEEPDKPAKFDSLMAREDARRAQRDSIRRETKNAKKHGRR